MQVTSPAFRVVPLFSAHTLSFIAKQNTPPLGAKLADRPARVTLFLAGVPEGQNPVMPRPLAAGIGILSLPSLLSF